MKIYLVPRDDGYQLHASEKKRTLKSKLERHIETLLESRSQIRLSEVLEYYPAEKGLAEILAYCVLAARDPRHSIDPDISEEIVFASLIGTMQKTVLRVPQIYFRRKTHAG